MSEYPDPAEGSRVHAEFFDINKATVDNSVTGWRVSAGQRPSDEYMAAFGYYGFVRTPEPAYDKKSQKVRLLPPNQWKIDETAKTVTQVWAVEPLTADEIAALTAKATAAVRAERNRRLRDSDFTQLADAPVAAADKAKWNAYRKALRDMTKNLDPFNPVWPEIPAASE